MSWPSELIQIVIFSLSTGGMIALSAIGLTLSYRITHIINFAYGEFLTIGAYLAIFLIDLGIELSLAVVLGSLLVGIIGVLIAWFFYYPLMDRGLFPLLITSIGLAFIVQNLVRMLAGSNPIRFPVPSLRPWFFGDLFLPLWEAIVFVIAISAMMTVHLVLRYTLVGRMMRAIADNRDLARVCGIPTQLVLSLTWFISAMIGGLAGILLGIVQSTVVPTMGFRFLLIIFAAVLLGGIGNVYGAMLASFLLSLALACSAAYLSPDYDHGIAFGVLMIILFLRPQGLLGQK